MKPTLVLLCITRHFEKRLLRFFTNDICEVFSLFPHGAYSCFCITEKCVIMSARQRCYQILSLWFVKDLGTIYLFAITFLKVIWWHATCRSTTSACIRWLNHQNIRRRKLLLCYISNNIIFYELTISESLSLGEISMRSYKKLYSSTVTTALFPPCLCVIRS